MARGDDEFVEFARACSGRLQHAAYLLTGDRHRAEDAAQTVLVRTYAAWSRVRRDDAYVYAFRILANLITDQWRRPIKEYPTEILPDRTGHQDLAEDVVRRRSLIAALNLLTAKERAVIVMRHYLDLSEHDVARDLNISLGSVKSLNFRGLAKLRISLDPVQPTLVPTTTEQYRRSRRSHDDRP